jgi:DNA-binding response OmpR family regulator
MQRRTLIVDDEAKMCEFFQSVLNATGMDVMCLIRSSEAVAYLQDEKFAVILLDLRMPTPDGIALARLTRGSGFNRMTPIIMLSEDQHTKAVAEGFEAGASFFHCKPIDKKRLLQLVRATQGAIEHERRRFRHISHCSRAHLSNDKTEWDCETIDVSLNGMMVRTLRIVPQGTSLRFSLYLDPGLKPVVGLGSVKRIISENQMGIQLEHMTLAETGRLQDFLMPLILHE